MKFETSAPPKPHPSGPCKLFLKVVDVVSQPSFNDANVMQDRIAWKFVSNKVDDETGERFTFTQWTNTRYGNPKAGLTGFANMLYPRLTDLAYLKKNGYAKPEDCFEKEFDSDLFLNKKFDAQIVIGFNQKNEPRPELKFIAPADAAVSPDAPAEAPDPFADDTDDPFADQ